MLRRSDRYVLREMTGPFVLALADVAWQRFQFTKRHMMSKQEVEDERRRSEGDPTMKMRQRRARISFNPCCASVRTRQWGTG